MSQRFSLRFRRAIRLEVSGAFHSPLMESAAHGLAQSLATTRFDEPACPVVTNVTARPVTSGAELRTSLERADTTRMTPPWVVGRDRGAQMWALDGDLAYPLTPGARGVWTAATCLRRGR